MIEWLQSHPVLVLSLCLALLIAWRASRYLRHRRKQSRPVTLHPNLEKYGATRQLATERRREAAKIAATSSTTEITGYEIVEQVEAVFVDGFTRPEEALEGLKASAAMKGANAIVNVRQERTSPGRYGASGDAVRAVSNTAEPPPTTSADPERRENTQERDAADD